MTADHATSILALHEAVRALDLARSALVRLGNARQAADVSDMSADAAALLNELRPINVQAVTL